MLFFEIWNVYNNVLELHIKVVVHIWKRVIFNIYYKNSFLQVVKYLLKLTVQFSLVEDWCYHVWDVSAKDKWKSDDVESCGYKHQEKLARQVTPFINHCIISTQICEKHGYYVENGAVFDVCKHHRKKYRKTYVCYSLSQNQKCPLKFFDLSSSIFQI